MTMAIDLSNYVTVAERLGQAQGEIESITTGAPTLLGDAQGYIQTVVRLRDGRYATGTASFRLGVAGRSAQATNPIEDAETSAVGRALALLGYSSTRGIASREEVAEAQRRAALPPARVVTGQARGVTLATNPRGVTYSRVEIEGEIYAVRGAVEEGDTITLRPTGRASATALEAELVG